MNQQSYFKSKIGKQTIAGIVTIGSFAVLYMSGQTHQSSLVYAGLFLLFSGMLSVPGMTFLDKHKSKC